MSSKKEGAWGIVISAVCFGLLIWGVFSFLPGGEVEESVVDLDNAPEEYCIRQGGIEKVLVNKDGQTYAIVCRGAGAR